MDYLDSDYTLNYLRERSLGRLDEVSRKINLGIVALLIIICWNTVILSSAHSELEAPDQLEAARLARMYFPDNKRPLVQNAEQRAEKNIADEFSVFTAENFKKMETREDWTEYIEDLQASLSYRKNIIELPILGVTLEKYSIEFLFGAIYSAILLFTFSQILKLKSSLRRHVASSENGEIIASRILKERNILPDGPSQLGIPMVYLATLFINAWNVAKYYQVKDRLFCDPPGEFKETLYWLCMISVLVFANIFSFIFLQSSKG